MCQVDLDNGVLTVMNKMDRAAVLSVLEEMLKTNYRMLDNPSDWLLSQLTHRGAYEVCHGRHTQPCSILVAQAGCACVLCLPAWLIPSSTEIASPSRSWQFSTHLWS